ncbi:uncharacterized protein LOC111124899 [Crassostrea virginica]
MRVSSSTCVLLMLKFIYADACTPTISGSSSIDLVVGNSHLLSCSYTSCTSKRTITWTVNGKSPSASTLTYTYSTSQNSANNTVHNGNSKFTYIPSRPSSSDPNSVKVICMAGSSTDSDSVTVNVQYGPEVVTLNTTSTFNVTEGNPTPQVACHSICNPSCTYKFHKDGSSSSVSSSSVFYISSIGRSNSGFYKCTATNRVSSRISSDRFELNVQYPPAFFWTITPSSSVVEGTVVSFVFKPSTTGNPPVYEFQQCSHYVGTTFLRHISYTRSSSEVSFTIQNASITDRGTYMCNVTNGIPNPSGDFFVTRSRSLTIKTPPLILMETKNVRETGKNYTLSVEFISLFYGPEVRWFRIMDDQTGEGAQNSKLSIVSYNVTKDNVTFNIPSYGATLTTKYAGRYVTFVKNGMGDAVVEYVVGLQGNEMETGADKAIIAVGSTFLVLGILAVAVTGFLLYKLYKERKAAKKEYREKHASIFLPPSAHALTPGGEIAGEVNPMDVSLRIENDDDSTPGHLAPDPPSLFDGEKEKDNAIYENNEIKHPQNTYGPDPSSKLTSSPLYETPRMVTEEEMRSKLKKNPHPYANEKNSPKPKPAKKPLKPNAKDGDYANFSFKKGQNYENHELKS